MSGAGWFYKGGQPHSSSGSFAARSDGQTHRRDHRLATSSAYSPTSRSFGPNTAFTSPGQSPDSISPRNPPIAAPAASPFGAPVGHGLGSLDGASEPSSAERP